MSVLSNARQEHSFSTTCIHGSILPSLEYPFSPHALPRLALVWLAFLGVVWLGLRVPESNLASPSENVVVLVWHGVAAFAAWFVSAWSTLSFCRLVAGSVNHDRAKARKSIQVQSDLIVTSLCRSRTHRNGIF